MNYEDIFRIITRNITKISMGIESEEIHKESRLCLLGLDSIGRAELLVEIMEDLGLDIPRSEFYAANNIGELAELFLEKSKFNITKAE